jgi:ATP-dependent DNA ligase
MGRWQPPAAGWASYLPDDRKHVSLYAFDLLALNGSDLRREPNGVRKATLISILRSGHVPVECRFDQAT